MKYTVTWMVLGTLCVVLAVVDIVRHDYSGLVVALIGIGLALVMMAHALTRGM